MESYKKTDEEKMAEAQTKTLKTEKAPQGVQPDRNEELQKAVDGIRHDGLYLGDVEANILRKIEFGNRLYKIWEDKLYKGKYKSFNHFVTKEFSFTVQQAMNYINSSVVFRELLKEGRRDRMPRTIQQCVNIYRARRGYAKMYKGSGITPPSYQEVWNGMVEKGEAACSIPDSCYKA